MVVVVEVRGVLKGGVVVEGEGVGVGVVFGDEGGDGGDVWGGLEFGFFLAMGG